MTTQTKEIQNSLTPTSALQILKEGNERFVNGEREARNYKEQVTASSSGQFPFAAVLSCIDSRVPVELLFDQGIGDLFSARVAGNIINEDMLGSLEYSCKVAGSKLVVVLGHSKCGAVTAACKNVELGNITPMLAKVKPAVNQIISDPSDVSEAAIEEVATLNVQLSIDRIRKESPILNEMEQNGEIKIMGAMYDVANGVVSYL